MRLTPSMFVFLNLVLLAALALISKFGAIEPWAGTYRAVQPPA